VSSIFNVDGTAIVREARPVIFDTDWWTDVDDAVAVRVLLWAERAGLVDIVSVIVNAVNSTSASSLSAFLDYEGRGNLCIGLEKDATDYSGTPSYHQTILDNWTYKKYSSNNDCMDSNDVYIQSLLSLPSGVKADIFSVGYPNALSRLLDATNISGNGQSYNTGADLVREKVGTLYMMAGKYPSGTENNFRRSARSRAAGYNICKNWPTKIVFLGSEIGEDVLTGGGLDEDDLLYKVIYAHDPSEAVNGREAWDNMLVLLGAYADYDAAGYTVVRGVNSVDKSTGTNTFTENSSGNHYYVVKKHPDKWYQKQINSILKKEAWPMRDVGLLSYNDK